MSISVPPFDASVNYYSEFWKLYLLNEICLQKIQTLANSVTRLKVKLTRLHKKLAKDKLPRKKHNRRISTKILKKFKCVESGCRKRYGSEASLKLHMKLKHLELPKDYGVKNGYEEDKGEATALLSMF